MAVRWLWWPHGIGATRGAWAVETLSDGGGALNIPSDIMAPDGYALVDSWFYDDYFNVPDGTTVQSLSLGFTSLLDIAPDQIEAFMGSMQELFGIAGYEMLAWALFVAPGTEITIPTDVTFLGVQVDLPDAGQTIADFESYQLAVLYQPVASGQARPDFWTDLQANSGLAFLGVMALLIAGGPALLAFAGIELSAAAVVGLSTLAGLVAAAITTMNYGSTILHHPSTAIAPNGGTPMSPGPLRPSTPAYSPCASSDVGTSGCTGSGATGAGGGTPSEQTNIMIGLAAVAAGALVAIAATSNRKG